MKISLGLLVSVSIAGIATPAAAQSDRANPHDSVAAADGGEDAIVVTALKRSTNLQDTAATIQAISGNEVQTAQIVDVTNVGRLVPSMQIYTSPLGNPALFLYGMGTAGAGTTFEQSVMPFFNGVANGHGRSMLIGTYDLQSIEVVKGTQAILGKNASLGAILVNSQKPRSKFEAALTGRYEFELDSVYGEGMVNVPVSDSLKFRFAGQYRDDGGWIHNATLNRDETAIKSYSGRASAQWTPASNFTLDLVYQYDHRSAKGSSYVPVSFVAHPFLPTAPGRTNFSGATGPYGPTGDEYRNHRISSTAVLDLDGVTITAITGYQKYDAASSIDADLLPTALFAARFEERDRLFSQELRLASDEGGAFNWLFGGYFGHDKFSTPIFARTAIGSTDFAFDQVTKTLSAFASSSYALTDQFELSGGVRVTSEQKRAVIGNTRIVAGPYSNSSQPPFPATLVKRARTTVDYSVSAKYEFSPELMAYVSYGQGTKSGGFNNQPKPAPTYEAFRSGAQFSEETAHTLEVGVKYTIPGIGYVNLSGFRVRVDNFQNAVADGALLIYRSLNQRSDGFTLDAMVRPIAGLSLNATVTYADTHDTSNDLPLSFSPKWSGNLGAAYSRDLGGVSLTTGVDLEWRSSQFYRPPSSSNPPASEFLYNFGSAQRLNARVALGFADGRYEVALLGRNLTNNLIIDNAYNAPPFYTGYAASIEKPRKIAAQFTLRY